jgi:hypothetical protein
LIVAVSVGPVLSIVLQKHSLLLLESDVRQLISTANSKRTARSVVEEMMVILLVVNRLSVLDDSLFDRLYLIL